MSKGKVTNLKLLGFCLKKYALKPTGLTFPWNNPIVIGYVRIIVEVLTNGCKSKFKTENKRLFLKNNLLSFLKTVPTTIKANSEKLKMNKPHSTTTFAFPLACPSDFLCRFF